MKNETLAKIADSELQVLHLLWRENRPMTMTEIRKTLIEATKWDGSTIKTLVYRLVDKGILSTDKQKTTLYKPIVSEEEYNEYATRVLIDKLYSGSAKNLVAALVNTKKLDDEDIEELRNMFKVGD